ncbi:MAG TPA: peptidylprolyl isomerase [Oscillospiraceae bacterium]|nr:peptidylprolyl isomerase [Oscillospiraceae bacterium]
MANDKSSAEAYRERRKKQIARANKKSSVSSATQNRVVRITVTAIGLILAASLIIFSANSLLLNIFGIPQKLISVATVDNQKITAAEHNYYYSSLYNDILSYSRYYEQQYAQMYGEGMGAYLTGYDSNLSPGAQKYAGDDEFDELSENASWADYFMLAAPRRAYISKYFYDEAIKNNITLSEDELKELNDEIEEVRKTANENNFSLNRYLFFLSGEGVNESLFKTLRERDMLASKYQTELAKQYEEKVTNDEIQKHYKENANDYDTVYFRLFSFDYADENAEDNDAYTKQKAKSLADNMLKDIGTAKDFNVIAHEYATKETKKNYENHEATAVKNITYSDVTAKISEKVADWTFASGRKANDKTVIHEEDSNRYFVVCMEKPKALLEDLTVNVRHTLVLFETTDKDGKEIELTDEIVQAAKAKAEAIYDEWKKGAKTEDSFAQLAKTKSEDPGSKEDGGLYEKVYRGQMVSEFENWSYDPARKTGDTGIIKTSYGYHIMYFVSKNAEPHWKDTARSVIGSDKYADFVNDLYKKAHDMEKVNKRMLSFFTERTLKSIDRSYPAYKPLKEVATTVPTTTGSTTESAPDSTTTTTNTTAAQSEGTTK